MSTNIDMWVDSGQRPREYAGLDWVNANSLLHPFVELGEPEQRSTIADLGSGTGAVACYLANYADTVYAVDISQAMLDQIPSDSGVITKLSDAREGFPFDDDSVDVVTARMLLHDLPEAGELIADAYRIVKPGGRLVLAEYVLDVATEKAITQVDKFEAGKRKSALVDRNVIFSGSEANRQLHRRVFSRKREEGRHLWNGAEFADLTRSAVGDQNIRLHFGVTPYNSVENWLGRSGFPVEETLQPGIIDYLTVDEEVAREMGMIVQQAGLRVAESEVPRLARKYIEASSEQRKAMEIDVLISRVFAYVQVQKG
jgi:SAM-dependent methyltransferase